MNPESGTRSGRTGFTGDLWKSIEPVFEEIVTHPFISGLTDGSLASERFRHYAVQDALYLREYSRALSLAAARAPDPDALVMFNQHAAGAIIVERSLHEGFFKEFGMSPQDIDEARMTPTTTAYTSYMIRTAAVGDYHELLCAVLPCYWIYAEVGNALAERGSPNPMYEKWISTYGGEDFNNLVNAVLNLTDRVCKDLDGPRKSAATEAFITTSRYEWMFWNAGWTLEEWPI